MWNLNKNIKQKWKYELLKQNKARMDVTVREKKLEREAPHPPTSKDSSVIESPKRYICGLLVMFDHTIVWLDLVGSVQVKEMEEGLRSYNYVDALIK